jgi:hypothetical protein
MVAPAGNPAPAAGWAAEAAPTGVAAATGVPLAGAAGWAAGVVAAVPVRSPPPLSLQPVESRSSNAVNPANETQRMGGSCDGG